MKKLLLALVLILPTLALSQHYHHNHRPHWRYQNGGWSWMVPAVIGGVVVYEIAKQQPPTVVIQQPPTQPETCGPWTEVQTPDGKIYRERTCTK